MLEDHRKRVFQDDKPSKLLFEEELEGKTLWQLRNDIAHGSLNILNENQIIFVERRLRKIESIAREYLRTILTRISEIEYLPTIPKPGLIFPAAQGKGGPGTEYAGPTDMAEYYANIEVILSSLVRVTFSNQ